MLNTFTEHKTAAGTAFVEAGSGEPLVLIHGVGLNKEVWQPQIEAFAGQYRVVAYDTLGHGNSRISDTDLGLDDYFDQLLELLDTLEVSSANLCGHSMGALITLGFCLKFPYRVRRIIPIMGTYDRTREHRLRSLRAADTLAGPEAGTLLKSTLERWFSESDTGDLKRAGRINQVRHWLQQADTSGYSRAYRVFAENGETFVGQLGDIAVPALFITAREDPNSTPDMSRRMASEVQQGQVHIMPGERHMGQFLNPQSIEPVIRGFLESRC